MRKLTLHDMVLHVLGSSSSGNGYVLSGKGESLLIEAGVPLRQAQEALGYDMTGVRGCIVSHEHRDHAGYVKDYLRAGIRVLALKSVFDRYGRNGSIFAKEILPLHGYKTGGFTIYALPVVHDAPCLAFVVWHKEMGSLAFITDTMMVEYKLPPITHLMVEANYSDDILTRNIDNGVVPASERERLAHTHMALPTAMALARACERKSLRDIILIHLSPRNSDRKAFAEAMQRATGKPSYAAQAGLTLTL